MLWLLWLTSIMQWTVLRWTCCLCTVGQAVHTLPEGLPVKGVTSLAGEIYVLRDKERDEVEVYDVITYRLQRCLTVPNAGSFEDMTSCEHYCYIYLSDWRVNVVHRLDAQGAATQWPVNDIPEGLSVNAQHNLLVTCYEARKIKEFTTDGHIVRTVCLPGDVINPWHTVQVRSGQFIVCHGSSPPCVYDKCRRPSYCVGTYQHAMITRLPSRVIIPNLDV